MLYYHRSKYYQVQDQCYNSVLYIWFRSRFGLLPFAGNLAHDRMFAKTDWLCRCKTSREEEGHITSGNCQVYGGLRTQFWNLEDDQNLVKFFQAVLDKREELEDEDRTRQSLTAAVDASSTTGNRSRTSQPGEPIL